jgi:sec-independent protein translocase protein TatC
VRTVLSRIVRILAAPIRFVLRPLRALQDFLNYEPEDTPTTEVFARALEHPSVLLEHLEALRRHLLRSVVVLTLTTTVSFVFAGRILDWLAGPVGGVEALRAIEVTESIGAFMRVSLLSGFALAFPYLCVELFLFIQPGLKPRERKFLLLIIPAATLLFAAGLAFAYIVLLPSALEFLLGFLGIETVPRPSNYIRFVTGLMFWMGVAFEFPLLMFALAGVGWVQAGTLARGWRVAIVAIAILAAAVTPTVDPVNMLLVMGPMVGLYFLGVLLAWVAARLRGI